MVGNPSTDQAYRGEADAENIRTSQEEINALHSSDPASISDTTVEYDEGLMVTAIEAFEQFDIYPLMTDGGHKREDSDEAYDGEDPRVQQAVDFGVTMKRPGNSVEDYTSEEQGFEPHNESPNYEEWANGFDDEEALRAFSGLFDE